MKSEELFQVNCNNVAILVEKDVLMNIPYFKNLFNPNWKQPEDNILNINFQEVNALSFIKLIEYYRGNKTISFDMEDLFSFDVLGIQSKEIINDKFNIPKKRFKIDNLLQQTANEVEAFNERIINRSHNPLLKFTKFDQEYKFKNLFEQQEKLKLLMENKLIYNLHATEKRCVGYDYTFNYELYRHSDIVENITLTIKLPALSNSIIWRNKVGLYIFQKIILKIGGIDQNHYVDTIRMDYYLNPEKYNIFDYDEETRKILSKQENIIVLPLKLIDDLPLVLLTFTNVSITFRTNIINELVETSLTTFKPPSDLEVISIINYGYLQDKERMELAKTNLQVSILTTYLLNEFPLFVSVSDEYIEATLSKKNIVGGFHSLILKIDTGTIINRIEFIDTNNNNNIMRVIDAIELGIIQKQLCYNIPDDLIYIKYDNNLVNIFEDYNIRIYSNNNNSIKAYLRFYDYLQFVSGFSISLFHNDFVGCGKYMNYFPLNKDFINSDNFSKKELNFIDEN